jgi:hypothetical protein
MVPVLTIFQRIIGASGASESVLKCYMSSIKQYLCPNKICLDGSKRCGIWDKFDFRNLTNHLIIVKASKICHNFLSFGNS